jgi:tetratricopeptide (TPR) repeat protein
MKAGNNLPFECSGKIGTLIICVILTVLVFTAFEGVRKNTFVNYDDDLYVTNNKFVKEGLSAGSVAWAFTTWHMSNWHPLTWISHIIDCTVFGLNPVGHHLVSVGFHIANVILLFLILKMMTGAIWPSAFVAAVFGLHPLAVESVAWVAERKNVLSTFFAFLTIGAYFRYTRKLGLRWYLIVVFLFAAGLLSKPMLVTLPFVLILLDYWPIGGSTGLITGRFGEVGGRRWFWRAVVEKIPLLLMSAASCVVTYMAQAESGAVRGIVSAPLGLRASNAIVSYVEYIGKIFYPASLAVLYPLDLKGPALWAASGGLVLLLAVTAVVIIERRRRRFLFTGWFWYLGTLVPVIGLVQVGAQVMADRYVYLPGIGIYIIVAWLAWELGARTQISKAVTLAAYVLAAGVLLMMTRVQVGYWKDSLSLSGHTLAVTKNNYIMHYNLGCALRDKRQMDEAAAEFKLVIKIAPDFADAQNNYGVILAEQKQYDEAIAQFNKMLELDSGSSIALGNMFKVGVKGGRIDEVLGIIRGWEQKTPGNSELYYRAGMLYAMKGENEAAIKQFETACRLTDYRVAEPLDVLSQAYAAKEEMTLAVQTAQKAIDAANKEGKKELAEQIKVRLELYQRSGQTKE